MSGLRIAAITSQRHCGMSPAILSQPSTRASFATSLLCSFCALHQQQLSSSLLIFSTMIPFLLVDFGLLFVVRALLNQAHEQCWDPRPCSPTLFSSGLDSLLYLDLSQNALTTLGSNYFLSLFNIMAHLNVSHNLLTTLETNAFNGLNILSSLDVSHNPVCSIEAGALAALNYNYLNFLLLNDMRLTALNDSLFSENLVDLYFLELQNNAITSISANAFNGMTKLGYLDLSNNQITQLDSGAFNGVDSLVYLYLDQNPLSEIDPLAFNWNYRELAEVTCGPTDSPADCSLPMCLAAYGNNVTLAYDWASGCCRLSAPLAGPFCS
eukprot:m.590709 g.590709  ORF g.590709 m.590709 type:complete len:324 (+) comp58011_c1_seq28:59-1030(+)